MNEGYINEKCAVTPKALKEFKEKAPKNAVILAAGYGMRMVPINTETPKRPFRGKWRSTYRADYKTAS